jgi:serine protease Do
VLNPRQRYDLSRALTALSPKPRLGHWARRLEKGGVMLKGVTAARAESVLGVLRAARVVAEARAHQQVIGRKMTWLLLGGASALAIALFIGLGLSRPTPRTVAARALPSVAVLRCGTKMGSGFFITEHKLLTNEHVATCGADGLLAIVLADGTRGEAHLIASDERLDLALVETTLNGPPLKLASAGELASGDTVMIAGAPMGLEGTFHVGTVSNPHRVLLDVCYLQLDARINPGNSGGPVLDAKGRAVAVVSMIQNQAESIGFAVPLDYAFEGAQPLMPRPGWHPTRGFTAMLAYAEHEDEQTVEESRRSTRVVNAFRAGTKRMVAALLTVSEQPPTRSLAFRLEYEGRDVCSVIGVPKWQQGSVGRGLSKRTNDWMNRKGIGKVWAGIAELDVSHCKFRSDRPIELILCEGDEKLNRTTL